MRSSNEIDFQTEFEYMVTEAYSMVLLCEPGESQSASGFSCFEEPWLREDAARAGVTLPEGQTLVLCWDEGFGAPVISRSLILDGNELWTLSSQWGHDSGSPARLQVNDLASLERLDVLAID